MGARCGDTRQVRHVLSSALGPEATVLGHFAVVARFGDADIDIHAAERRGRTDERAPQRQRVPLVPRHGHTNQVAIPDDAVGGVEVDPSGSRQVRLHPGVRCSTADGGARLTSGTKM